MREIPLQLLFAVYTLLSVAGMVLMKYAMPLVKEAATNSSSVFAPTALVAAGAGMYVVSFALWMVILARTPLTVAYPIAVGLTMALSTFAAVAILGEAVKWQTLAGMCLVFAGIVLLSR
jgi:multidrug transporter EmrE-like cation transporter